MKTKRSLIVPTKQHSADLRSWTKHGDDGVMAGSQIQALLGGTFLY